MTSSSAADNLEAGPENKITYQSGPTQALEIIELTPVKRDRGGYYNE